jgi:hypothetical protein
MVLEKRWLLDFSIDHSVFSKEKARTEQSGGLFLYQNLVFY